MPPSSRLPIFPLPLVLLPRAVQPLHVFESRYRQLLRDCMTGAREFGIVFRTPEVAEHDIPAGTAGCVAHVESTQSLPDGRSNVIVVGTRRFALDHFVEDAAPYLVAEVYLFDDEEEPDAAAATLAARLRELFVRVGRSARAIQDDTTPLPELPESPSDLSFAIGQFLDLDLSDKQRLLSSRSPLERLQQLDEVLAPVVESVEQRARIHTRARTNGHGTH
jgi:ATP-dependent Lon protease